MTALDLVKGISALVWVGSSLTVLLFVNFLLRRGTALYGIPIAPEWVHAFLGPILLVVNGALLVLLCALHQTPVSDEELQQIRAHQVKFLLGPLCNPFYAGRSRWLNGVGYAFLILLWWLAMHSFLYSINLNTSSRWLFGWQTLISALFLALGYASMIAVQGCWEKFGVSVYAEKWKFGMIGIPIGAFLPPLLLGLGLPKIFP
jgi:hypothetical protein